ncbi:MAG: DNA polymerase III subunit epsilon, partial [Mangrovicoccus sp.]
MLQRLSLRLRVFLFFGLLGIGHLAILGASIYVTLARGSAEDPVSALTSTAIMAGFLSFGLVTLVWYLFDENVAKAIETLATELRTRAHGGVDEEIDRATARYLGDLAPAASAMTGSLVEAKTSLEENVAQHTARLSEETERLKTLVGDVPVGLIVCRPSHQMVFYNSPAKDLLAGSGLPRLNRSIFDLLREAPIRKTYDRLVASEGSENDAEILISTVHCARSLAAHMRLVRGALGLGDTPGYVLTLRDVTADLAMHTERERLLSDVVARIRRPAAKLKALIDLHQDLDDPKEAPALTAEILKEADDLTGEVQSIAQLYDDTMRTWWPMQDVRASDLIDGIRAHMEDESLGMVLDAPVPALLLRCDGFALTSLLSQLIRVLHERHLA